MSWPSPDKVLSVSATKMSGKSRMENDYQTNIFDEIVQTINGLLNSEGGQLDVLFDKLPPLGFINETIQKIKRRIYDFTSLDYFTIFHREASIVIIVRRPKGDSIYTLRYHLYLASNRKVIELLPRKPVQKLGDILCKKVLCPEVVKPGAHCRDFTQYSTLGFGESRRVKFRSALKFHLEERNYHALYFWSHNLCQDLSAFANYGGGHLYIGIDDYGIVRGQVLTPKHRAMIKHEIRTVLQRMIWPVDSYSQGKEEKRWQIHLEEVKCTNGEIVPSTYIIVVYVAQCPGGVFVEEPEAYEFKDGEAKKLDFTTWKKCFMKGLKRDQVSVDAAVLPSDQDPSTSGANVDLTDEESPEMWKWIKTSEVHAEKFQKLLECGRSHPEKIEEVNGVRVCFSKEFCIGVGADGTRVYIGLGKDGCEKAVKRLLKDICTELAEKEKEILLKLKSSNVVKYWFLSDEHRDGEYLFLILDLCEETLEDFVKNCTEEMAKIATAIIRQVLEGIYDLHYNDPPILHRDLKPKNILRNVKGNWLLADFGISRVLPEGVTSHDSIQRGTTDWRAVESYPPKDASNSDLVRYKKQSDIQVAGMVAFYILTKGEHPFGEGPDRQRNLLDGNPVYLDKLKDPAAKDLISWMLSHDPKERPSAKEALKHPYLQSSKRQFELLSKIGNQPEIKTTDHSSTIVAELNSYDGDWQTVMEPHVLKYLCTDLVHGVLKTFIYGPSWTECLRLIRNVDQHNDDRPRPLPQPTEFHDPQEYFLKKFPNLPVVVYRIVRQHDDWKKRPKLEEYFI